MNDNYMGLLERYLEVTNARHSEVVRNVANVDTPGYRTRDVDFRSALRDAVEGSIDMPVAVHEVQNLVERPDGNNVSLDREGILLSETQLQFRIGVQLVRTEFKRWLTAINEGK